MQKDTIPSRANWDFGNVKPILKDKHFLTLTYIRYMLSRTQRMFEYENLPETIPQRDMELLLQTNSFIIGCKDSNGKLYVMYGGLGGLPSPYYQPTIAIVANPYLRLNKTLKLEDYANRENPDAVIIWNDSAHIGLLPMFERYASMIAEVDISLRVACVNSRIPAFFKAKDDTTKDSIESMLEKIEDGEIAVIGTEEDLIENGDKTLTERFNVERVGTIKELIELKQYLTGSWYNEVGLNANFNMKREAINESEADLNEDALLPYVADMLESRRKGWEAFNKMFGTNVKIKLSSSWYKIAKEVLTETPKEETENIETVTNNEDVKEN